MTSASPFSVQHKLIWKQHPQIIQIILASAVTQNSKHHHHITPVLQSILHTLYLLPTMPFKPLNSLTFISYSLSNPQIYSFFTTYFSTSISNPLKVINDSLIYTVSALWNKDSKDFCLFSHPPFLPFNLTLPCFQAILPCFCPAPSHDYFLCSTMSSHCKTARSAQLHLPEFWSCIDTEQTSWVLQT